MTKNAVKSRSPRDAGRLDRETAAFIPNSLEIPAVERPVSMPSSLPGRVAEGLGRRIVTEFAPKGLRVPTEAELCRQYGASRTAVREAMKQLIAQGLVSVGPRTGARIRPEVEWGLMHPQVLGWLSARDPAEGLLVEFLELRLGVEPSAAALAARNASEEDRRAIRQALDDMAAAQDDRLSHLASDIAFHRAILNATANRFYAQLNAVTEASLELAIRQAHNLRLPATSLSDHVKIGQAVLSRDPVGAADAMREHLLSALQNIKDRLHLGEDTRCSTIEDSHNSTL